MCICIGLGNHTGPVHRSICAGTNRYSLVYRFPYDSHTILTLPCSLPLSPPQIGRSLLQEEGGDVAGAADVLQEVHVETYGSLSKREKIEFILEQLRLTLGKKDYVRAYIVSGKVLRKHLKEESMEDYKVRFFTLMAEYHRHEKDSFELAKDYHEIYSTPSVLKDDAKWKEALQSSVLFLALSPYTMEQQEMMNRINTDSNLEKLPAHK